MSKNEIFDVVNEKDEVVGTASREECHSNPDLIHHTVHFTLIDRKKKKIYLTQRSLEKDHDAGKYCFLGEHMLAGESYDEAVKRGVEEELGFVPNSFVELAHNIFSYQTQTEFIRFFLVDWFGEEIKWDKREMEKVLWVDVHELAEADYDYSKMTRYWIDNIDWDGSYKLIK